MFTEETAMKLPERQQQILQVIEEAVRAQGYPPNPGYGTTPQSTSYGAGDPYYQ